MNRYIPSKGRILDVGAGTGVYSFYYASKGYKVNALDITPKHVEEMKSKVNISKYVSTDTCIEQGDVLNLERFNDGIFDVVICFGPIYHLRESSDRYKCISECMRVLKTGGFLAVAYISKFHNVPRVLGNDKRILKKNHVTELIRTGNVNGFDSQDFLSISHFDSPEDIEWQLKQFDLEIVSHIASEGIAPFICEDINKLSEDNFKLWLEYHFQTCSEKSMLGISNHGMVIAKKG
jgi:ubiquinone/menaquinone biosynthesis C-methylase UbiE